MSQANRNHNIAYSVAFLFLSLILEACGSQTHFELDKQPRQLAPGETIAIGLTAVNPPQGARYGWYSDQGKCEPAETESAWTKYTAPTQSGEYHITVEVRKGGRMLFSDGVSIRVGGQDEATHVASSQSQGARSATPGKPTIHISQVPAYDPVGGPTALDAIAGDVSGVDPKSVRVVLYAFTDNWYVQPFIMAPFTDIEPDGKWSTQSHLGSKYAALLVKPGYHPRNVTFSLPGVGDDIVAVATAAGRK